MRFTGFVLALLCLSVSGAAAGSTCYDLSKSEPRVLTGVLSHRIFPGAPGFADVRKGDAPEPGYLLTLPAPICLTGDDFADPKVLFSEAQLVETDKTEKAMQSLLDTNVTVTLSEPMAAETGHHHRPLVAWVEGIVRAQGAATDSGAAGKTVEAFYQSLAAGKGDEAASFIVPEQRRGPFSGDAMTRFYAGLPEPLQLLSLQADTANSFLVRYKFRSASGICDGKALVRTSIRGGANLIESIKALDGC